MDSMELLVLIALFTLGACLGSFVGAQVWRLRARQLVEDKKAGEKVSAKEYKRLLPLTKQRGISDRSIDLDTGKPLPWYDMIPVVSWMRLRGRSRYSGKPIGQTEFWLEVGMGAFFVLSYLLWPGDLSQWLGVAQFAVWLIASVMLAILFVYDLRWFLLPDRIVFPLIAVGAMYSVLVVASAPETTTAVVQVAGATAILSGLYWVLWLVSRGAWIGFGDVKLGLALALLLADWRLAFIALFAANLIGCLVVLPGMIRGKVTGSTRIPFGPLLILGMVVAGWWGDTVLAYFYLI